MDATFCCGRLKRTIFLAGVDAAGRIRVDELLLSDEFGAPELIADDGDALYSFPPGTTEREILFYLAGEAAGARGAIPPRSAESDIYGKLLALIRHAAQQGIKIETLMHKALDRCDPEPPFSR